MMMNEYYIMSIILNIYVNFSEISQHKFCPGNFFCTSARSPFHVILKFYVTYIKHQLQGYLYHLLKSILSNRDQLPHLPNLSHLIMCSFWEVALVTVEISLFFYIAKLALVDIISYHQLKLILLRRWPTSTLSTWPLPTLYWPCSAYPFRWNHHHHHHHTYYHHNMVIITIIFDHISNVLDNLSGELIAITIIIVIFDHRYHHHCHHITNVLHSASGGIYMKYQVRYIS